MKYNFDALTDRRGTLSYKWNVGENELPMWVADMDFETSPAVKKAILERAENGIFGYSYAPDEFFRAVSGFYARRHGFEVPTEWMIYSNGVVAALSSAVRRLTSPGENVLIQPPVYNIFYNSILNNGRNVLSSELVYDGTGYHADFADLERKLADPQTSLMILCNPHNPVGKLWSREELEKIGELCAKHGVAVFSDEIHCDVVKPGKSYVPFASVNELCAEISVSAVSPSKTFNLAGLQSACLFVKNPHLRHKIFRGINNDEVGEPNAFSMYAGIAAYNESDEWLDALLEYLFKSRSYAEKYVENNIPKLKAVSADATYLLWVDISQTGLSSEEFCLKLRERTGLYVSEGVEYGRCGDSFIRINLATQSERLTDGLARLKKFVDELD